MASAPEWQNAKWGMYLELPFNEKNKDFLEDMKSVVPSEERNWNNARKQWWVSDAYLDEVDSLLLEYFDNEGYGRE